MFFLRTSTCTTLFQLRKVIVDVVNDCRYVRTQPLPCRHSGYLENLDSTYAIACTVNYHVKIRVISCDLWFLTLFRWEIPHVAYRKFNTGICNEWYSQREHTIALFA